MLKFGASKPRVKGGPGSPGPPLDPHLTQIHMVTKAKCHDNAINGLTVCLPQWQYQGLI